MIAITRDAHSVLACSILTAQMPAMPVDGEVVGAVVIVGGREAAMGKGDGLVIVMPITSLHATDSKNNLFR